MVDYVVCEVVDSVDFRFVFREQGDGTEPGDRTMPR